MVVLLLAISAHEAGHAWMSHKFGDDTAYMLGRVTLNPIKHIDPVGTILVPLIIPTFSLEHHHPLWAFDVFRGADFVGLYPAQRLVLAVQKRVMIQCFGGGDIGADHEFFDQPVAVVARPDADG